MEGIYHSYGIRVADIRPWGPVWRVATPSGVFALKRTRQQPSQIIHLARFFDRLNKAGFTCVMTLWKTLSGEPFTHIDNEYYLFSPWIEGDNPDFTNRRQLDKVVKLYGRFHRISEAISSPHETGNRVDETAASIRNDFLRKKSFLMEMADYLRTMANPNRIDRHLLKWSGHFIRQADFCIEQLARLAPDELHHTTIGLGLCHNDPAPGNIIIRNRELYLIDFELASFDPFIQEAAKLMVRVLQANQWPADLIPAILAAYESERKLSMAEVRVLPYLCAFPRGFWRLCNQRFQERLPWTQTRFQKRLWELTNSEPARVKCLKIILPGLPEPVSSGGNYDSN
jgi:CotS family spore coat protein